MENKTACAEILNRPELKKVRFKDGFLDWLDQNGFFIKPASISHHGMEPGDLWKHSLQVADSLVTLTNRNQLEWQRPGSPLVVGLFHDLCKMDNYTLEVDDPGQELFGGDVVGRTYTFGYNKELLMDGHGDKSVMMLAPWVDLTEEEVAAIRWHMGAFDEKTNWNYYGKAVERWPNVLWTHTADMIAARVIGV